MLDVKVCQRCHNRKNLFEFKFLKEGFWSKSCLDCLRKVSEFQKNFREAEYRKICFNYHERECVVCGEDIVIDVHHLDGNRNNNSPENLIPLCPTHHKYWHIKKFRHFIEPQVRRYILKFLETWIKRKEVYYG